MSLARAALFGASTLLALAACGSPPHSKSAGGIEALTVRPVAWNAAQTPVGNVKAVADTGDTVCIFADDGATVMSPAGALVAHDTHIKNWVAGDSIYAVGESTRWIIGVDATGHLYRLKAMSAFEDVGQRWQLWGKKVHTATIVGPGKVGFLLDGEIAFADSNRISVFGTSPFDTMAGGGGFAVGVTKDAVELLNSTNGLVTRFALPDAQYAVLDSRGRLFAATKRGVYAADAGGTLDLMYDADHESIHGLVASGDLVWFADGSELGAINGVHVGVTSGANIDKNAKLQRSPTGDVWVLGKQLARYSSSALTMAPTVPAVGPAVPTAPTAQPTIQSNWTATVGPVFARSCAKCHQPDGVSGVDLSTEAAWTAKKDLINDRVLVTHTMPPDKNSLSETDRNTIHTWLMSAH